MNSLKTLFLMGFIISFSLLSSFEGINYSSITHWNQNIHLLEVDPSLYEIKPIKASHNGIDSLLL